MIFYPSTGTPHLQADKASVSLHHRPCAAASSSIGRRITVDGKNPICLFRTQTIAVFRPFQIVFTGIIPPLQCSEMHGQVHWLGANDLLWEIAGLFRVAQWCCDIKSVGEHSHSENETFVCANLTSSELAEHNALQ